MIKKYYMDMVEVTLNYRDAGPWRSYEVTAAGNSIEELLEDAWVFEVDQDGGDIRDYALLDSGESLYNAVHKLIQDFVVDRDKSEYIAS